MKAISIDDKRVVMFSSEQQLAAAFDAECVSPQLATNVDIDTIYVFINPFEIDVYGRRVLCWHSDESEAKREEHELYRYI
jgi:hypothetical protein